MEVAGLAVGVAGLIGLYRGCIDIVEQIESYKHYEAESQQLMAKLNADKAFLQSWARSAGLTADGLSPDHDPRLDDVETAQAVTDILACLRGIFDVTDSSDRRTDRQTRSHLAVGRSQPQNTASANEFQNRSRKRDKLAWTFGNKRRFAAQVELFGELVQKINQLVPCQNNPVFESLNKKLENMSLYRNETPMALLTKILRRFQDEDREKFLSWLGPIDYEDQYEACRIKRTPGTCSWIFDQQSYMDWSADSPSNGAAKFLWIHGGAGFGKSVLSANIVRTIQDDDTLVFHYFYSSASTNQNDPMIIIRAWLRQMVDQHPILLEIAADSIHQAFNKSGNLTIWKIFAEFVSSISGAVFVIDGLDQCATLDQGDQRADKKLRGNFISKLKKTMAGSENRVLIVSRAEADIRDHLSSQEPYEPGLHLYEHEIREADVESDVLTFSRATVGYRLKNKPPSFKDEIATKMANKCEGMFLWVDLQAQKLRSGKNTMQLSKMIEEMPKDLESIYRRDWEHVLALSTEDRLRALDILRWATFGKRPLTVGEITEALVVPNLSNDEDLADYLPDSIDEDFIREEIIDLCGTLLEIRQPSSDQFLTSQTIHLKHFSVQQFLHNTEAYAYLSDVPHENASTANTLNNHLAISCLRYLKCCSVERSLRDDQPTRWFLDYAVGLWHSHISAKGHAYPELINLALGFFDSKDTVWDLWQSRFEKLNEDNNNSTDIIPPSRAYYAAFFGLWEVIEDLYSKDESIINCLGGIYGTPIKAACVAGHVKLVLLLSRLGADLNIAHGRYGTLLGAASKCGELEICEHLLSKDIDLHRTDEFGRSPIHIASQHGHEHIVQQLLDSGVNISFTDYIGRTPLYTASKSGYVKVVLMLLNQGAEVSIQDNMGWTPLHIASLNCHLEITRILLDRGADISTTTNSGLTLLHIASTHGHLEIVRILLDHGAETSAPDNSGWTPLHFASTHGYLEIVRLLLDHGVETSATDISGRTPLHFASTHGYLEITRILLDRGADISTTTNLGWTPLHFASDGGHLEIVRLLLDCGAEISNAKDTDWTPLKLASESGHLEVVRLLLDRGAEISNANNRYWSPLHLASEIGHLEVVRLLLGRGAKPSTTDDVGWTALHRAADQMHVEVAQLLLRGGSDPNSLTVMSETPLHLACRQDRSSAIRKLLFDSGCDPLMIDGFGRTALDWAIMDPQFDLAAESWPKAYTPTPTDKVANMLRSSFERLVSEALVDISRFNWYNLGQVLRFLQDETNALLAYQQTLEIVGSEIHHSTTNCDRCRSFRNIRGHERFVCKSCADIDLCANCYKVFRSDDRPWRCQKHDFLRVHYDESALLQRGDGDDEQRVQRWFKEIQELHLLRSD